MKVSSVQNIMVSGGTNLCCVVLLKYHLMLNVATYLTIRIIMLDSIWKYCECWKARERGKSYHVRDIAGGADLTRFQLAGSTICWTLILYS